MVIEPLPLRGRSEVATKAMLIHKVAVVANALRLLGIVHNSCDNCCLKLEEPKTSLRPLEERATISASLMEEAAVVIALAKPSITSVIAGQIRSVHLDTATVSVTMAAQVQLGLDETACFFVEVDKTGMTTSSNDSSAEDTYNTSIMHAIRYERAHQLYPVREQYTFAIPQLSSDCVCDCPGGEDHCSVGFSYKNCTASQTYCVRTYHAHQPSIGCQLPGEADLCCEVTARPLRNWRFGAVYLGQPLSIATFRYYLLAKRHHRWEIIKDEQFEAIATQAQRIGLTKNSIQVQLNGVRAAWQLKESMYFYRIGDQELSLRHGVPINRFHEHSVNKIGWFRWQEDKQCWDIRNGRIKMQAGHFLRTTNCQQQEYAETYNVDFFVSTAKEGDRNDDQGEEESLFLGHPVTNAEKWISNIRLVDRSSTSRQVVVEQNESPAVHLTVNFNGTTGFTHYYHGSDMSEFTGTVQMDSKSNRYLNITVHKAKGTLIGEVFDSNVEDKMEFAFSSYVGSEGGTNVSILVGVPASVNSSKWICLHPYEKPDLRKCRWISYTAEPLPLLEMPHGWVQAQGHCVDCNQLSPSNFLSYLNPANWVKGVNGWSEALAVGLEVAFYGIVALIVIALCRRLLCPVVVWSVCSSSGSKKNAREST
uniref:Uncharacterized protein n=1 Tax=Trichuris muris TaxID=70415 RepID=A0A5S6R2X1_TRIMR